MIPTTLPVYRISASYDGFGFGGGHKPGTFPVGDGRIGSGLPPTPRTRPATTSSYRLSTGRHLTLDGTTCSFQRNQASSRSSGSKICSFALMTMLTWNAPRIFRHV